MSDFQHRRTFTSARDRSCPECRTTIPVGTQYSRETGCWEGDFYSAIMCLPCRALAERYIASMQTCSWLRGDEVSYTFGSIIEEAAEHVGHSYESGTAFPVLRDAVMALFDPFDEAERAEQARERENLRRIKRAQINYLASRAMIRGMSEAGRQPHLAA